MNNKLTFLALFLFLFTQQLFAQTTISGTLQSEASGEALNYATIRLLEPEDSSLVTGGITDDIGYFNLEAKPGNYILQMSYITFATKNMNVDLTESVDLGVITLNSDEQTLGVVEVIGEKSEVEFHLDKKVFTVGKDLTAVGTDAIDILDNVPSVSTDVDGNVSLRGSEGVQILINGKQSALTGLGSTNALKNIPSNLIEKIEVITNPSSRYDAQGQVGIINIVLKKQQNPGLNGSFDVNAGTPSRYGAGINLNYRQNKVNLFTNLGFRYRSGPGEGFNYFEYFNPSNGVFYSENDRDHERSGLGGNGSIGAEYFFTENQTLTGTFRYGLGDDKSDVDLLYSDFDQSYDLMKQVLRTDDEKEDEKDWAYTLAYHNDIDKDLGRKLTADVRFETAQETERSDYSETQVFGTGTLPITERSVNKEGQDEYLFQIDYVHPFSKSQKFEVGAKSTLRDINTDFTVERNTNGEYQPLPGLDNEFVYDEDIHAVYGMYGNEVGKVGYQAGLRAEYTDINTKLLNTNEENPRDYLKLFPSAFVTYDVGNENSVQLSYSRRIRRPGFWHLNPFLTYSDARRQFAGNPNLNPEYTNSFELGYLKNWDKTTLNSSIYYRKSTDVITRITQPLAADTVKVIPVNLNERDAGGFEFILNSDITKWWTVDANFNLFYFKEDGQNVGNNFTAEDVAWFSRLSNRFRFNKDFMGQLRFMYRGPSNTTQGKRDAMYNLDLGLSKEVLNGKGTISFNGRNILNTRRYSSSTTTDAFYNESEYQWGVASFNAGFNYRINQNNKQRRQNQNRGDDDGGGFDGGEEGM